MTTDTRYRRIAALLSELAATATAAEAAATEDERGAAEALLERLAERLAVVIAARGNGVRLG